MSSYLKRQTSRLYTDGKNYVLSSQFIKNEHLLITVMGNELFLNKICDEEWQLLQSKSRYVTIIDAYGCLGMLTLEGNFEFELKSMPKQPALLSIILDNFKEFILLFAKEATSVSLIGKFEILRIADIFAVNLNITSQNPDEILNINTTINNNSNTIFVELR